VSGRLGYPHTGTKRASSKTKTIHGSKREAQAVLAQLKAKHQLSTHDLAGEQTTVERLLRRWMEAKRHAWSPKTVRETKAFVDRRIVPELGDRRIGKLGVREIEEWYGRLLKAGRVDKKGRSGPGVGAQNPRGVALSFRPRPCAGI
jgi:hypothetical protein